uniref:Putative ldl receptor adaptor protein n=1 Tax=Rhipicephalus pulchellus TaxID=72859 RepID=L7M4D7_RHIPC
MTSIWKSVWSSPMGLLGRLRHKKLSEEWVNIQQPVVEGITFYAKYLGSTLVEEPSGDKATADAIKAIIAMAKASGKKLPKVAITVSPKGISTRDLATGELQLDVSIYRISFCSADASFDRVVAFIGTHSNEVMECHAFLCAKRRVAQAAALTISQAFQVAYQAWQGSRQAAAASQDANSQQDNQLEANGNKEAERKEEGRVTPLIDLSSDTEMEAAFGRLGASPPLFSSGLKPQEEEELRQFVASGACSREAGLLDREDDLLSL